MIDFCNSCRDFIAIFLNFFLIFNSFTYLSFFFNCSQKVNACDNVREVEFFKVSSTIVFTNVSIFDSHLKCLINKNSSCYNCKSINEKCTTKICAKQFCCENVFETRNSANCNDVNDLCIQTYNECSCTNDDYDVVSSTSKNSDATSSVVVLSF